MAESVCTFTMPEECCNAGIEITSLELERAASSTVVYLCQMVEVEVNSLGSKVAYLIGGISG
jgi:hypothetical protein